MNEAVRDAYRSATEKASRHYSALRDEGLLCPFPTNAWKDVWLEWRLARNVAAPARLLLLQDWGDEMDGGDEGELDATFVHGVRVADPTLRNLQQHCREEIHEGRLLVMNAVWGLRASGRRRVGYLGDVVHKAAIPCWSAVVEAVSGENPSCGVLVAGDWGRWKEHRIGSTVSGRDYFSAWQRFSGHEVRNVPSEVSFIPHPCTWGYRYPKL